MIPFLAAPITEAAAVAAVLVALCVGLALAVHEHDNAVRAAVRARQQSEAIELLQADHDREVAALQAQAREAEERATAAQNIKGQVNALPSSTACVRSPGGVAVLRWLRERDAAGAGADQDTGHPARVPAAAPRSGHAVQ